MTTQIAEPMHDLIERPTMGFLGGQVGLYQQIAEDDYHAFDACSQSKLKTIKDRSPMHCKYQMDHPKEPTDSMKIGSAVDCLVLEPWDFEKRYAVAPKVNKRTNAGKAELAEFMMNNHGKDIIEPKHYEPARIMADRVLSHNGAKRYLDQIGEAQTSGLFRHGPKSLLCKFRLDWWIPEHRTIADLKTTRDASPKGFQKSIADFGYHIQAGMYIAGMQALGHEIKEWAFICVENTPPYGVAVYRLENLAIQLGWNICEVLLDQYAECKKSGVWPGYGHKSNPINLPRWVYREMM